MNLSVRSGTMEAKAECLSMSVINSEIRAAMLLVMTGTRCLVLRKMTSWLLQKVGKDNDTKTHHRSHHDNVITMEKEP